MLGSEIQVRLDQSNAVKAFFGNFYQDITIPPEERQISKERAIEIGLEDLGGEIILRALISTEIMWYPTIDRHRKAYLLKIPSIAPLGDWEYFIDIETEEILDSFNMMCFSIARAHVYTENPEKTPNLISEILKNLKDPIKHLDGTYCRVLNEDGPEAVAATSISDNENTFYYTPENTHFDEVQVYYFADRVYEYFLSLGFRGFTTKNRHSVITGNVHVGMDFNNAYYSPMSGQLYFGDGSGPPFGLNDLSKSFDIVAHELTHAVIDEYQTIYGIDGCVLHEGYADYFACTLSNDPNLGEYVIPGEGNFMLTLNNNKIYPGTSDEPHQRGEIWGGACWQLRNTVGQEISDYLLFGSILFLPSVPSFKDAKDRILFIDKEILDEQYSDIIKDIFENDRKIPV